MGKRRNKDIVKRELGVRLDLSSGFTVSIKPLPPYYKELIDEVMPLPEYPTRKISLAAGDVIDWQYDPPAEALLETHPDYNLYVKWKSVDAERQKVEERRKRARQDFLIANCVKVVTGPLKLWDNDWAHAVEAAFPGYTVPTHPGKRMLVFLKTQVILSVQEMEMIIEVCTSPEASMQGIINALRGFQDNMAKGRFAEGNRGDAGE
jgi:hypothetical protein